MRYAILGAKDASKAGVLNLKLVVIIAGLVSALNLMLVADSYADHIAIFYCEEDESKGVIVVAADSDPGSGISSKAKIGHSCSRSIHEVGKLGYVISHVEVSGSENEQVVFVLEKNHHD